MSDMKQKALAKATTILNAIGVKYTIDAGDGDIITKMARQHKPERTAYKPYIEEHVNKHTVGELASLPVGEHDAVKLRGSLAGYLHRRYGAGNSMTHINTKAGTIEYLVMADGSADTMVDDG